MAQSHDYIPKGDAELQVFAANVLAYATENFERWKVPSPKELLEASTAAFVTALGKFNDPNHGKVVDYATAYENGSGKRGPWSNVTNLLISG